MEVWDLYTKERELTGKTHIRGEKIPPNYYHLVVHVWIVNSKGEYLISRRSASRPTFPLLWECVGGSVIKGENSLYGALREAEEEVGIKLIPENGKVVHTNVRTNDILDVWLFNYDGNVDLNLATTDEVCETKWVTKEAVKQLFKENKLVPTLEYFFEKL